MKTRRFDLFLQVPLLLVLVLNYLPWAFVDAATGYRFMFFVGAYLLGSFILRHAAVSDRIPTWAKTFWLVADTLVWLWGQRASHAENPAYGAFVLVAAAAMIGWQYGRGAVHTVAIACVMPIGLRLDYPYEDFWINFAAPNVVGSLLVYGCVYLAGRASEASEAAARARQEAEAARREAEIANGHLREHARQIEEVSILRERNRLAREVHDTIAHGFTGIIIQLDVVRHWLDVDRDRAHQAIDALQEKARDSLAEVRRSVHALRPLQMEERRGLGGIQKLVDDLTETGTIRAALVVTGAAAELPASHELCLYRTAQEGLTNAVRHGHAANAAVRITWTDTRVVLEVTDDGKGESLGETPGFGLVGIRERAELLGGSMSAGSVPGGSFRLSVALPLSRVAQPASGVGCHYEYPRGSC